MATGDVHITVVPATSSDGTSTFTFNDPGLLEQFINEQQAATPAKTLFDISFRQPRTILTFKES